MIGLKRALLDINYVNDSTSDLYRNDARTHGEQHPLAVARSCWLMAHGSWFWVLGSCHTRKNKMHNIKIFR